MIEEDEVTADEVEITLAYKCHVCNECFDQLALSQHFMKCFPAATNVAIYCVCGLTFDIDKNYGYHCELHRNFEMYNADVIVCEDLSETEEYNEHEKIRTNDNEVKNELDCAANKVANEIVDESVTCVGCPVNEQNIEVNETEEDTEQFSNISAVLGRNEPEADDEKEIKKKLIISQVTEEVIENTKTRFKNDNTIKEVNTAQEATLKDISETDSVSEPGKEKIPNLNLNEPHEVISDESRSNNEKDHDTEKLMEDEGTDDNTSIIKEQDNCENYALDIDEETQKGRDSARGDKGDADMDPLEPFEADIVTVRFNSCCELRVDISGWTECSNNGELNILYYPQKNTYRVVFRAEHSNMSELELDILRTDLEMNMAQDNVCSWGTDESCVVVFPDKMAARKFTFCVNESRIGTSFSRGTPMKSSSKTNQTLKYIKEVIQTQKNKADSHLAPLTREENSIALQFNRGLFLEPQSEVASQSNDTSNEKDNDVVKAAENEAIEDNTLITEKQEVNNEKDDKEKSVDDNDKEMQEEKHKSDDNKTNADSKRDEDDDIRSPQNVALTKVKEDVIEKERYFTRCDMFLRWDGASDWQKQAYGELRILYHPEKKSYRLWFEPSSTSFNEVHSMPITIPLHLGLTMQLDKNSYDRQWSATRIEFKERDARASDPRYAIKLSSQREARELCDKIKECLQRIRNQMTAGRQPLGMNSQVGAAAYSRPALDKTWPSLSAAGVDNQAEPAEAALSGAPSSLDCNTLTSNKSREMSIKVKKPSEEIAVEAHNNDKYDTEDKTVSAVEDVNECVEESERNESIDDELMITAQYPEKAVGCRKAANEESNGKNIEALDNKLHGNEETSNDGPRKSIDTIELGICGKSKVLNISEPHLKIDNIGDHKNSEKTFVFVTPSEDVAIKDNIIKINPSLTESETIDSDSKNDKTIGQTSVKMPMEHNKKFMGENNLNEVEDDIIKNYTEEKNASAIEDVSELVIESERNETIMPVINAQDTEKAVGFPSVTNEDANGKVKESLDQPHFKIVNKVEHERSENGLVFVTSTEDVAIEDNNDNIAENTSVKINADPHNIEEKYNGEKTVNTIVDKHETALQSEQTSNTVASAINKITSGIVIKSPENKTDENKEAPNNTTNKTGYKNEASNGKRASELLSIFEDPLKIISTSDHEASDIDLVTSVEDLTNEDSIQKIKPINAESDPTGSAFEKDIVADQTIVEISDDTPIIEENNKKDNKVNVIKNINENEENETSNEGNYKNKENIKLLELKTNQNEEELDNATKEMHDQNEPSDGGKSGLLATSELNNIIVKKSDNRNKEKDSDLVKSIENVKVKNVTPKFKDNCQGIKGSGTFESDKECCQITETLLEITVETHIIEISEREEKQESEEKVRRQITSAADDIIAPSTESKINERIKTIIHNVDAEKSLRNSSTANEECDFNKEVSGSKDKTNALQTSSNRSTEDIDDTIEPLITENSKVPDDQSHMKLASKNHTNNKSDLVIVKDEIIEIEPLIETIESQIYETMMTTTNNLDPEKSSSANEENDLNEEVTESKENKTNVHQNVTNISTEDINKTIELLNTGKSKVPDVQPHMKKISRSDHTNNENDSVIIEDETNKNYQTVTAIVHEEYQQQQLMTSKHALETEKHAESLNETEEDVNTHKQDTESQENNTNTNEEVSERVKDGTAEENIDTTTERSNVETDISELDAKITSQSNYTNDREVSDVKSGEDATEDDKLTIIKVRPSVKDAIEDKKNEEVKLNAVITKQINQNKRRRTKKRKQIMKYIRKILYILGLLCIVIMFCFLLYKIYQKPCTILKTIHHHYEISISNMYLYF